MSNRTVSYQHVKDLVSARLSTPITSNDEPYFKALLNDGAISLFDRSAYWPRFLTLEPRTVNRGYIADDEDGYFFYGAELTYTNGLYSRNGTVDGRPYYSLQLNGADYLDLRWSTSASKWQVTSRVFIDSDGEIVTSNGAWVYQAGDILYDIDDTRATPPEAAWDNNVATGVTPVSQKLGLIEHIIWQFDGEKWSDSGSQMLKNYRDKNGIRSTNGSGKVWVAYKEQMPTYGDGTSGTTGEIPYEFSRYIALHCTYEMQRANRQGNPSDNYTIAQSKVEAAAQDALLGITREGARSTIMNIKENYYTYDVSIRN